MNNFSLDYLFERLAFSSTIFLACLGAILGAIITVFLLLWAVALPFLIYWFLHRGYQPL